MASASNAQLSEITFELATRAEAAEKASNPAAVGKLRAQVTALKKALVKEKERTLQSLQGEMRKEILETQELASVSVAGCCYCR